MNLYFFIIFIININVLNAITLKAIAYIYSTYAEYYTQIVKEFNKYSKKNNLDINLELTILSESNSTSYINDYGNTITFLLKKKSTKYDIYFYYDSFIKEYEQHFTNLYKYLDKDFFNKFPPELILKVKRSNNDLTGIPCAITTEAIYSNEFLLSKYGKKAPKTWDEFLKTGKYILDEERKLNNTDLIGYNGLFSDDDNGSLSLFEFFNSFRESNSSPYPLVKSEETRDALEMIKRIKNELSTDEIFRSGMELSIQKLIAGKAIFLKMFYMGHLPNYIVTAIPGKKIGVSGCIVSSSIISISQYVEESHKKAAVEFIRFFSSEEIQKKYLIKNSLLSPLNSLYDDEEVCTWIDCDVPRSAQPYSGTTYNLTEYSAEYYFGRLRQYAFDYIYGNETVSNVIKKIDDMRKIYYLSLKTDDSPIGLLLFIFVLIILVIMIIFTMILYIKSYDIYYNNNNNFFPNKVWIISLFGSMIILSTTFTFYEKLNVFKCFLQLIVFTVGYLINVIPIFNQLVEFFPFTNIISKWFQNSTHKFLFLSFIIITVLILIGLSFFKPYTIQTISIYEGENYQICTMKEIWGIIIIKIIYFIQMILLILSLVLIFLEWNIKKYKSYLKILSSALSIDVLLLIIYEVFNYVSFGSYKSDTVVVFLIIFFLSVSNFIFIYLIKINDINTNNKNNTTASSINQAGNKISSYVPTFASSTYENIKSKFSNILTTTE